MEIQNKHDVMCHEVKTEIQVNGETVYVTFAAHETLLEVLRNRLGLTGAKKSCDVQVCGACTVLLDGRPVSACTTLAWEARGREVRTAEGLTQGGVLSPLQKAFIEHGAFQCGFCTSGMLVSAQALLERNPHPTRGEIIEYMDGNICRCTGYDAIVRAIEAAANNGEGVV